MVMAMPLELSLACPTLHRGMGPPDPHPLELPPFSQHSVHHPLLPCILREDPNSTVQIAAETPHLPSHAGSGSERSLNPCAWTQVDSKQLLPSSQCKQELADVDGMPLTLVLAHEYGRAAASANDRKRACPTLELGTTVYSNASESADQERTLDEGSSRGSEEEVGRRATRKKLRLSKEESALLEEKFKEHSTLTPKQKTALAKQLSLQPRQVEVWFQNRRARTKLKQTEVDCEVLRKCCASLTEENRRLQMEVAHLRALSKVMETTPDGLQVRVSETAITICPQCQRISANAAMPSSSTITTSNSSSRHQAPTFPLPLSAQPQASSSHL